ncbi:hypothetical protein ABPG72_003576 [Tetrahymena utriculariae]
MIKTNYRTIYNYVTSNQFVLDTLYTQKQDTQVNSGLFFQKQEIYSSPIQYNLITQNFDRNLSLATGLGPYSKQMLLMDEIVQQFQIEYPTIIEILALVHAIAGLAMIGIFFGRFYSQMVIKQDFNSLFLQNICQGKYQQICLHDNNLPEKIENPLQLSDTKEKFVDSTLEYQSQNQIITPNLKTTFRDQIDEDNMTNTINTNSQYLKKILTLNKMKKTNKNRASNLIQVNKFAAYEVIMGNDQAVFQIPFKKTINYKVKQLTLQDMNQNIKTLFFQKVKKMEKRKEKKFINNQFKEIMLIQTKKLIMKTS